jgi:TRAP transporter TAXI family solute receptor
MKARTVSVCLTACIAVLAITLSPLALAQTKLMTIGTGSVTGVYYAAGGAICRLVNRDRANNGLRCTVEASAGSLSNIDSLVRNALNFGVVQSDVQYAAVKGINSYQTAGAQPDLRAVFSMYPEMLTVLVGADSSSKVLADLKKQRLSVGLSGSGSRALVDDWTRNLGWAADDIVPVQERSPDQQGIALCEKKIDAMAYVVGHPAPNVARIIKECNARLLGLLAENVDKYLVVSPFAVRAAIPANTYPGQTAAVNTIAVLATLMTSASTPDDMVYSTVKAVFDNFEELKQLYPALTSLDPKVMVKAGLSAPMHPGAAKYFKEKGWL